VRFLPAVRVLLCLWLGMGSLRAFSIIVSNRAGTGVPAAPLANSSGQLLAPQSLGRAAALQLPAGATPASLILQCGLPQLWSYSSLFGPDIRLGFPPLDPPGVVEQEVRAPLPLATAAPWHRKPIFLYFFNAPTLQTATEALLLEFPATLFNADLSSVFEAQVRLHLSTATVRFGSRQADGSLRTAPLPWPCYQRWAAGALGGSPATAPLDDPDRDGVCNLLEYLHGTQPGIPDAALSQPRLEYHANQTITFSWRQAPVDAHAVFAALATDHLQLAPQPLTGLIQNPPPPYLLPPGIQWRSLQLPATAPRRFLTLKGTLLPASP
jgi:hypothetical protein